MSHPGRHLPPLAAALLLAAGATGAGLSPPPMADTSSAESTTVESQFIPASDPRFRYEGRLDLSEPGAPMFIWQGSRVHVDFTGDSVALAFSEGTGQNCFDLQIDGKTEMIAIPEGASQCLQRFAGFGPGRHRLVLFKRTEADAGAIAFRGLELPAGAKVEPGALAPYPIRMQFFGDSITVGACNEDGLVDQWEDRSTHNNALSYAAMTADAFSADYRNIAVSGMGVVTGYVDKVAGEIWDRLYPSPHSPRADLTAWVPDVLFVNLGENDDSSTKNQGQPFPASWTAGYVKLIRDMRTAWPKTHIVLLRGGMFCGAKSELLREAWEGAVKELEAGDPAISHYVFEHWSETHPRVSDARAMADELTAWLKTQPHMRNLSKTN